MALEHFSLSELVAKVMPQIAIGRMTDEEFDALRADPLFEGIFEDSE